MAALPPRPPRRRARPGSLERPVNGRLYRGTWLIVGIPLLIAAFSVRKAEPLPTPQPVLPASFDRAGAVALASELAETYPDRTPGTPDAAKAARWFADQVAPYGLKAVPDRFRATLPGGARKTLVNQVVTVPGKLPAEIVVMAHRDDGGGGAGANDNASGIATLIQLARSYGTPAAAAGTRALSPMHTLVFVATDGGAFGGLGARHFAQTHRGRVLAVVNLDTLGSRGPPRLVLAGSEPRLAAPGIVATASQLVLAQAGQRPHRASPLAQLVDLGFPFTLYEQGPLLAEGLPALTLTSGGERPPSAFLDRADRLDGARLASLGRSAQQLVRWLDSGIELAPGTATYIYFGPRILQGWAIELVLIAALVPFLVAAVDLFARCRRRHIPLGPALRSYRSRAGFWLWTAAVFLLFALLGFWPAAPAVALPLTSSPGTEWPVVALVSMAVLVGLGWFVARARLLPSRAVSSTEELAGATGRAVGARRRLAARRRDEPVRADLPAAVCTCLALASAGARQAFVGARRPPGGRVPRTGALARLAGVPLRDRARHALVSRRADGHRLRQAPGHRHRRRLARRGRPGGRALGRSLRAVPDSSGATAARADQGDSQTGRAYS